MLLFIEGYPYTLDYKVRENLKIKDILEGIVSFPKIEKIQSFDYVRDNIPKKNSQKKVVKSIKIFFPIFLFGFIVLSVYIRRIIMIIYLKAENTKKRVAVENRNTIPY